MIRFNHFNFNVVDLDRSLTFYRDALGQGRSLPDVGQQRLLIGVHPVLPPRQGVEVAVGAFGPAEGGCADTAPEDALAWPWSCVLLGGQDDDGLEGTVHLTGPASDAAVQIHRIKAVRLQKGCSP